MAREQTRGRRHRRGKTSTERQTQARAQKHTRSSDFKPGVRLFPITGAIQGVIMVILIIYKEQRNPPMGGRGGNQVHLFQSNFPLQSQLSP